jgi:hypothetical protein
MRDWRLTLDAFLKFNEREILDNPGKVSKEIADRLALAQYEMYNKHRLEAEALSESLTDHNALIRIEHELEEKGYGK